MWSTAGLCASHPVRGTKSRCLTSSWCVAFVWIGDVQMSLHSWLVRKVLIALGQTVSSFTSVSPAGANMGSPALEGHAGLLSPWKFVLYQSGVYRLTVFYSGISQDRFAEPNPVRLSVQRGNVCIARQHLWSALRPFTVQIVFCCLLQESTCSCKTRGLSTVWLLSQYGSWKQAPMLYISLAVDGNDVPDLYPWCISNGKTSNARV